jgi:hypothetical protein
LDGPLPKLCPAVTLSHQAGRHSAVALLLKATLIQMSDYRQIEHRGKIAVGSGELKKRNNSKMGNGIYLKIAG